MKVAVTKLMAVLMMIALPGLALAQAGPCEAELKAKNDDDEHWEGPHVRELMAVEELEEVLAKSEEEPVLIFKHSTACPVSAGAAYRMNEYLEDALESSPEMVFLKVRERRPVSNEVEKRLEVKHESPQLLLVKDGKSLWDTSHRAITAENLKKALDEYVTVDTKSG